MGSSKTLTLKTFGHVKDEQVRAYLLDPHSFSRVEVQEVLHKISAYARADREQTSALLPEKVILARQNAAARAWFWFNHDDAVSLHRSVVQFFNV